MKKSLSYVAAATVLLSCLCTRPVFGESQGDEYKGVTDPFGDPTTYEFSEDEKSDKEFFHLGRFVMLGLDMGGGVFTGGLGVTNTVGFYIGGNLTYFFDKQFALELGVHYASDIDTIAPNSSQFAQIFTVMVPITLGFRYYFDVKNAPKAIAVANPYLVAGPGLYLRSQSSIQVQGMTAPNGSTASFGAFVGGGIQFAIYGKHLYLGADARYHFIFFPDAGSTLNSVVPAGSRSGGYFTPVGTVTYSF